MQQPVQNFFTPEEYLLQEEKAEFKHEYYQGKIYAMAGASVNHTRITRNVLSLLNSSLKNNSTCEAFMTDMRVWIEEKDLFTYPDILVVCSKLEFYPKRDDTISNPLLIIEVLSDSTKNYDRGEKFMFYRSIPSFSEYILIDQYSIHVEHFFKTPENHWMLTEYKKMSDVVRFSKINFEISLEDIYTSVEFK